MTKRVIALAFATTVAVAAQVLHAQSLVARSNAKVIHAYGNSLGYEVDNVIAVSASKLTPLLPAGYTIVPAASLGFGRPDQGIVVIANFRGIDPTVDERRTNEHYQVAIDVALLVTEPDKAAEAGVSIPGAYHLYALTIYTNDAVYAASLRRADMPVELVNNISYQREMDDASGIGDLIVRVPDTDSAFSTVNSGQGYFPVPGALNAVFWHDGHKGTAVLHFLNQPFRQGSSISRIYTKPHSTWAALFDGGGLGPCSPDPRTGFGCVIVPGLNLRFDQGTAGKFLLIK
jgi:hypothetical protein